MGRTEISRTGRRISPVAVAFGLLGMLGLVVMPTSSVDEGSASVAASSSSLPTAVPEQPAAAEAPVATDGDGPTGVSLEGYSAAAPVAAATDAPVQVQVSAPPGAKAVKSTVNHPDCGLGFTMVESDLNPGFCIHTAADPLPAIGPVSQPASKAPVCMGNGVNGPRIELIYIYVEGQPNRSSIMVPRIANEFIPRMESTYRETSKFQGREIGMRLNMPDCKLKVDTLMIDQDNGQPDDPGVMLDRITTFISEEGYSTSDRKYIVWFDGGNKGACGVAPALTPLLEQGLNPTQATTSNIGWQAFLPETALIFRYGFPVLGNPPPGVPARECWGQGGTGARTELHELLHNLGAVNLTAPNSNGFGHCVDDHDIMCYGEQGVLTKPRCATVVEQLDCGADDYFNVRPNAGSYLSTHWNTANSKFLGDALVDNVPLEIPRP